MKAMKEKMIVYGTHTIAAIIQKNASKVKFLYFQRDKGGPRQQFLLDLAGKSGISFQFVSKEELDRLSQNGLHQGVVALCQKANAYTEADLPALLDQIKESPFLLLLDCIEDPHNLGACLRTANAAGVDIVIAPKDRSAGLTPVAYKAASGASDTLPFIQVTNLATTIKLLKKRNIWIFGAAGEASQSLYETDLAIPMAFVLGNEGKGLRRLTKQECDILVHIPMAGSVSSLNVSVSAGVCLFEAVRQRSNKLRPAFSQ